jgi:hypothetical protein
MTAAMVLLQIPILTSAAAQETQRLLFGGSSRGSATSSPPPNRSLCFQQLTGRLDRMTGVYTRCHTFEEWYKARSAKRFEGKEKPPELADVSAVQLHRQLFARMHVDKYLSAGVRPAPSRHVGSWNETTG